MVTNAEPAQTLIASQGRRAVASMETILWFDDSRCIDVGRVGGKNASLANMTCSLAGAGDTRASRTSRQRPGPIARS